MVEKLDMSTLDTIFSQNTVRRPFNEVKLNLASICEHCLGKMLSNRQLSLLWDLVAFLR